MANASETVPHDAFVRGIAEILWGLAWAQHVEGHRCRSLSGCEITEAMPEIPAIAWYRAERVAGYWEGACGHDWAIVFAAAMKAEGVEEPDYTGKDAVRFGNCACYALQGHGVSWYDDHDKFVLYGKAEPFKFPYGGGADEAQVDLEDYAAEHCPDEGTGVRCKDCGAYNRGPGDRFYDPGAKCEGCSAKLSTSEED